MIHKTFNMSSAHLIVAAYLALYQLSVTPPRAAFNFNEACVSSFTFFNIYLTFNNKYKHLFEAYECCAYYLFHGYVPKPWRIYHPLNWESFDRPNLQNLLLFISRLKLSFLKLARILFLPHIVVFDDMQGIYVYFFSELCYSFVSNGHRTWTCWYFVTTIYTIIPILIQKKNRVSTISQTACGNAFATRNENIRYRWIKCRS